MNKQNTAYLWSSKDPVTNMITCRASGRKCTRELPSFDNRGTTLLNSSYEITIQPTQKSKNYKVKT